MANVVAYPDLALEKFTGLDPNEDARDFLDIVEKKIAFSLGTRPGDAGDEQDAYDNRQRALFGSILRGPAAQWYQGLAANLPWNDIRDQFIDGFTDDKDKYRRRIEAENIKRQPDEFIKSYIHRLSTAVDRGWPNPTFNDDQRTAKKMEFFVRGLSPPGLKQKAHQFLIENPPATWQQLKDHIAKKDLSFAVSSEFTGTASSSVDNKLEIEGIKDQLKELTGQMKDHKINAAYNPNEPRNKQNHTRFCKWFRRSGHTISVCLNTETTKIKTENQLSNVKNSQTIIIEDLGLEKKIVITIDTMAITSEITIIDHILPILDSSIIEQIVSIDLDLKVLDQEIEISIIDLTIKLTQIVIILTTRPQITIIKKEQKQFYTRSK